MVQLIVNVAVPALVHIEECPGQSRSVPLEVHCQAKLHSKLVDKLTIHQTRQPVDTHMYVQKMHHKIGRMTVM